jgi:serine protease Do
MRTLIAIATAALLCGCASNVDSINTGSTKASPVVRVDLFDGGHGSGVYIGNGIVLTAGHVGNGQQTVTLKLDDDTVQFADVLWVNTKYDVAALRPVRPQDMTAAHLSCRAPAVGEAITAAGSPGQEDNLHIPGAVVGAERKSNPWESVVIASLNMTGGISGGGVFDKYGDVVGIVVGGQLGVVGSADNPAKRMDYDLSQTGLAYVVPGDAICALMGRA